MGVLGDGYAVGQLGMGCLVCGSGLWGLEGVWVTWDGEGNDGWCAARPNADGGTGARWWE